MVNDSDPRKWEYKEHTRAKHELLEKYLRGWVPILGSRHERLLIFDGFAGRGEYEDKTPGSPQIIVELAQEFMTRGTVGKVLCAFVERNSDNFGKLNEVIDQLKFQYPDVPIMGPLNSEFAVVVKDVIEQTQGKLIPSFFFIDPFGFTGMPFSTVKEILSLNRAEVFVTFMTRDIGRFLTHPDLEDTFDSLF